VKQGEAQTGQLADLVLPTPDADADLTTTRLEQRGGRQSGIDTAYFAYPLEDVVDVKGKVGERLNPAFELEFRLPELRNGSGPYEIRACVSYVRTEGGPEESGVDVSRPETWPLIPDMLLPEPPAPAEPTPPAMK